jgi:hypothetical protein
MPTVKKKPQAKSFDIKKYQVDENIQTRIIEIDDDSFEIQAKYLSWFKRNEIMSKCLKISTSGDTNFDGALYVREVLKEIVVGAPWGKTTDGFLISINTKLGEALESIVAEMGTPVEEIDPEETKKELTDTPEG